MRTKESATGRPPVPRGPLIQYQPSRNVNRGPPPTRRMNFIESEVGLWGWPSRGGVIVLRHATALDFDFLGLDPVDPPMLRDRDQDAEDALCQRLLLLGAKWFDSDQRRGFIAGLTEDDDRDVLALTYGEEPPPTAIERRWVSVAYPDGRGPEGGGLWVAEFDTVMHGVLEEENQVPPNAPQVHLARNMAEKVEVLKRIGGKFYASLEEYERGGGKACLNSWATKTTGEGGLTKA
ncbi:hypothetical protein CONLIGDRAFT_631903 [Coniochaeta ligniaria NRRL 30616]|uniref:Uncharacterized protein n=1 Tax=Coniochaeta ligniaria NRRL 30616 TaxID=1408157 RepID=A0A1J7IR68_9PEZI|nr:hypothetical protein CONLIGDRAFT_631903 [Coniochaeta ligniaria NRRL 30616]